MTRKTSDILMTVLSTVVILALTACSKDGDTIYQTPPEEQPAQSPLVTVVYDPDALGDRSFNDLIYQGVEQAAKEYGLRTLQLSPSSLQEGLAYLETMFQNLSTMPDTIRRLVIITTPTYDEFVRKNNHRLENNPHVDLLYLEARTPLEGKGSTLYIPYYGAMFEGGAIAPHFTNEVLVVGANPENKSVHDAIQGFCDGFATNIFPVDDEEKTCDVEYLGNHVDEGFSIADTTALKFLMERREKYSMPLLVPICGGAATTFHRMNEVVYHYMQVGVDVTTVSTFSPLSVVKHMDRAVNLCIQQWLSAEGMPKHQSLGLAEGYTGIYVNPVATLNSWGYYGELTGEILQAAHDEAIRKEAEYER